MCSRKHGLCCAPSLRHETWSHCERRCCQETGLDQLVLEICTYMCACFCKYDVCERARAYVCVCILYACAFVCARVYIYSRSYVASTGRHLLGVPCKALGTSLAAQLRSAHGNLVGAQSLEQLMTLTETRDKLRAEGDLSRRSRR